MEAIAASFQRLSVRRQPHVCLACRSFSATFSRAAKEVRRKRDPYREAQAQARRAANISRQINAKKRDEKAFGDPVLGVSQPTAFLRAVEAGETPAFKVSRSARIPVTEKGQQFVAAMEEEAKLQQEEARASKAKADAHAEVMGRDNDTLKMDLLSDNRAENKTSKRPPMKAVAGRGKQLNYFLGEDELERSIHRSWLYSGTRSLDAVSNANASLRLDNDFSMLSGEKISQPQTKLEIHNNAAEALRRITNLQRSSSQDKMHVAIKSCIDTFGRHRTDEHLPSKPAEFDADGQPKQHAIEKTPRAGPDTGSSEVQISILTAKIRVLSQFLSTRGKKDKMNKRNLRVLVHKRQKLLKYLERKERGGPRFRNVVDVLGLTPASWKGEISL